LVLHLDPPHVVQNHNPKTFQNLVANYAPYWLARGCGTARALPGKNPLGPAPPAPTANLPNLHGAPNAGAAPVKGLNVPPASSIPAVSIMTDEPRNSSAQTGTPSAGPASAQHPATGPRATPRPPSAPSSQVAPPIQLSPDQPNPG
jgi:hypothetical protein